MVPVAGLDGGGKEGLQAPGVEGSSLLGRGWCGRRRTGGGVVAARLGCVWAPGMEKWRWV